MNKRREGLLSNLREIDELATEMAAIDFKRQFGSREDPAMGEMFVGVMPEATRRLAAVLDICRKRIETLRRLISDGAPLNRKGETFGQELSRLTVKENMVSDALISSIAEDFPGVKSRVQGPSIFKLRKGWMVFLVQDDMSRAYSSLFSMFEQELGLGVNQGQESCTFPNCSAGNLFGAGGFFGGGPEVHSHPSMRIVSLGDIFGGRRG